ncbi:MAG: haloalkane dehalogenase [Parvibaculales bacterium]
MTQTINPQPHPSKSVQVMGRKMAYVELGDPNGRPIVFQHGNPTSSYLWRNIMPHAAELGRCIALDLIGMGNSEKLEDSGPQSYSYAEHNTYFRAALEALGIERDIVFVIHDWGSALGFHYASDHPERVSGICYMEGIVRPFPSFDDWPENARNIFQVFRSPDGDVAVLEKNVFVEGVLRASITRDLSDEEMAAYRAPYVQTGEDRRPTLSWPRQIPIGGEPADVTAIVQSYAEAMAQSPIPKLFINAEPGSILTGAARDFCRSWPNQSEVTVSGLHFIQEDSPHEIGAALADWIREENV